MSPGTVPHLVWKKSCDSCRKYKKALDQAGVTYTHREMNAEPLSQSDLESIIGERPLKPFLNTRNVVYRELKMNQALPAKKEAIALMAETNNLLKRPVLLIGDERIIGARLDEALKAVGQFE
ncbi:MAG: ArsC/Spx/MgsR family protein [Myxococcota bacterium]|nr:ArsC/Spx/MgsR family protein [Myxococcota bacterium]